MDQIDKALYEHKVVDRQSFINSYLSFVATIN